MSDAAAVVGLGDLGISIARRLHAVGVAVAGIDGAEERRTIWEAETGLSALASTADLRRDGDEAPVADVSSPEPDVAAHILADDHSERACVNSNRCVPAQMLGMPGACYNPKSNQAVKASR